jgi:hypothetical protein
LTTFNRSHSSKIGSLSHAMLSQEIHLLSRSATSLSIKCNRKRSISNETTRQRRDQERRFLRNIPRLRLPRVLRRRTTAPDATIASSGPSRLASRNNHRRVTAPRRNKRRNTRIRLLGNIPRHSNSRKLRALPSSEGAVVVLLVAAPVEVQVGAEEEVDVNPRRAGLTARSVLADLRDVFRQTPN